MPYIFCYNKKKTLYQNENTLQLLEAHQQAGYEDGAKGLSHVLDCCVWTGNLETCREDEVPEVRNSFLTVRAAMATEEGKNGSLSLKVKPVESLENEKKKIITQTI